MKRLILLSVIAVAGLALAACAFASPAEASPMITAAAHAAASAPSLADLGAVAAIGAAGVTAGSTLQAGEDLAASVATAPRVSLDGMKAKIKAEHYFTVGEAVDALGQPKQPNGPLDILTVCVLVMENDFTIIGKSAPASAANFDAAVGQKFALDDAIRQLWPLEGYALREQLAKEAA